MSFDIKGEFSKLKKTNKEEFSKITLKNKKEFDNMFKKSEKIVGYVKENLEDKFFSLKYEYEKEFLKNLGDFKKTLNEREKELVKNIKSFESTLKDREKEFFEKYRGVEDKQIGTFKEFEKFKEKTDKWCIDIENKILEESKRINEESKLLKESKKKIDNFLNRKFEKAIFTFEDKVNSIIGDLIFNQLKDQNSEFYKNENSFRLSFNSKIKNLEKTHFDTLKNFKEDFSKELREYLNVEFLNNKSHFDLINEKLNSRQSELDNQIKSFDSKLEIGNNEIKEFVSVEKENFFNLKKETKDEVYNMIKNAEKNFEEKFKEESSIFEKNVEEIEKKSSSYLENFESRTSEFEKKTNKKIIDMENDFTTFKTNILNEFDELLSTVKETIDDKISNNFKKVVTYIKNRQDKFEDRIQELVSSKLK